MSFTVTFLGRDESKSHGPLMSNILGKGIIHYSGLVMMICLISSGRRKNSAAEIEKAVWSEVSAGLYRVLDARSEIGKLL